jgi:hypothetical protein
MMRTVLSAGLLIAALGGQVGAMTISTCGQVADGHAELAADLDCSAFVGVLTATAVVGRGSTIIHNGENPDCASGLFATSLGCADLAVSHWRRPPVVVGGSVCGHSQRLYEPIGRTWGACAGD